MKTNQVNISITDRAEEHILAQLKRSGSSLLRLGVKESGCNGFMYTLDYLMEASNKDSLILASDEMSVCALEKDLTYVSGTEIDLVTEGLNSALVFKNPKAQSYCGCGESFSFDSPDTHNQIDTSSVDDLAENIGSS